MLSGSLQGCWYTKVDTVKDNGAPSGIYLETGREVFVGSLNGGPVGVISDDLQVRVQVGSGCLHRARKSVDAASTPSCAGSGTGGFAGATGRVDFKDIVADGTYVYRGHISVP